MAAYYDLARTVGVLVLHMQEEDAGAVDDAARHIKSLLREINGVDAYPPGQMQLVFRDLFSLPLDTPREREVEAACYSAIRSLYGDDHPVLSDICTTLSERHIQAQRYPAALQYTGQSLLIRTNRHGLVHEKTADSHYNLGVLYRLVGASDKSRQELRICRGIRCKLFGEGSLAVAQCDVQLGHAEVMGDSAVQAYVSYYRCYHARHVLLGVQDALTQEAGALAMRHQTLHGERLVAALELKQRVLELQWGRQGTRTWLYAVAVFVGRLGEQEALTLHQLRMLVAAAVRFSDVRMGAAEAAEGLGQGQGLEPQSTQDSASASVSVSLTGHKTDDDGGGQGGMQGELDVLVSMLLMIPTPTRMPSSSPTRGSPGRSRAEAGAGAGAMPKLRSPKDRDREGDRDRNGDGDSAGGDSDRDSPVRRSQGQAQRQGQGQKRLSSSAMRMSVTSVTSVTHSADSEESKGVHPPATPTSTAPTTPNPFTPAASPSPSLSPLQSSFRQKTAQLRLGDGGEEGVGEGEGAVELQGGQRGQGGDSPLPAWDTTSPGRETWRPLRSPYHSAAWSHCAGGVQKVPFEFHAACASTSAPSSSGSAPSSSSSDVLYARDQSGVLLVVRRADGGALRASLRPQLLALGLLPWLAREGAARLLRERRSVGGGGLSGVAGAGSGDTQRRSSGRKGTAGTAAGTRAAAGAASGDPRAALNALFGSRSPPKQAPASASAPSSSSASMQGVGRWAKKAPAPPPLPFSWPPEPFLGTDADLDTDAAGAGVGVAGADGGLAVGTVIQLAGVEQGPKLKQMYLLPLPSIEGTLWAESSEQLITFSELFDDLEAQFSVDKPKAKKVSHMPFGGKAAKGATEKAKPVESLLEAQRAQNINIMLAKFGKRSYFDIAQSVSDFAAEALGSGALASLAQFIPTAEEAGKVQKFVLKRVGEGKAKEVKGGEGKEGGESKEAKEGAGEEGAEAGAGAGAGAGKALTVADVDNSILTKLKLGKAEMYIFVFSQVALLDTRLSAMGASLCAQETSSVIVASAEVILTAVTEIRGSGRLRFLLRAFLDLSNALAKSSKSHETMTGIKLASLEKVQQSKVNSGETVLQYVVGKIAIKMPEALQVGTDMPSLEEARLVLFPRMAADLRKLGEGVDTMKKIIDFDRAAKEAEVGKEAGTEKAGVEVGKEGVDMGKEEGAGKEAGTGAEVEASAESTGVEGADDRPSLLGRDSTVSMEAVAVVAPLSPIERAHQEAQRLHLRASERLAEAQRDFAELCAYFGETDVEPDKLFGQVIAFVRGVEGAAKTTKKRKSAGGRRPVIKLPNMIQ